MLKKIILVVILSVAFVLRFYSLGDYPALNADEAAIGYNAYSLIETGKDEHGNPWPIHFQSFNDYKPGLYVYLVLPFVKFFGLSEWSVRTPNAFLGVLTVYLVYLLVIEFYSKRKTANLSNSHNWLAVTTAFFLAISPWHIHFSRGGWEVNTATFLITLATLFFIKYINSVYSQNDRSNKVEGYLPLLFMCSFVFSLSLYTYHSARIIAPLQIIGLLGIYFKEVKSNIKNFLLSGLIGLVAVLPLAKDFVKPQISSRASGVGILADTGPFERVNEERGEHENFAGASSKLLHNKLVNYSLRFLENYSEHFHGLFLFLSGDDIERNKVPETGQMYMIDILWVVLGIWLICRKWTKENRVVVHWLLIAPVAAALTFQSPHALRAQNMVIPLTIICALGFTKTIFLIRNMRYGIRISLYVLIVTLISWQFLRYLHMYYNHMSPEYPYSSQYGIKELVEYLSKEKDVYDKVVVTTRYDQPYILFLFYSKYSPAKFQNEHILTERDRYGFSTVPEYNGYAFKEVNWDEDKINYPKSLVVGTTEEIPDEANVVKNIYGTNGFQYFRVVAN